MKLILILLTGLVIAGCSSQPANKNVAVKSIQGSELGYIETGKTDKFVVKNAQAMKQFNKVILFSTQFDKLQLAEAADKEMVDSWNKSSWDEMDKICQHLDDFAKKVFSEKGEFVPVMRGGEDVLAIQFSLIDFMPYSKRYKDTGTDTVGSQTNMSGIGLITIRGVLANAKTGELIAVVEDTMEVNPRVASYGNLSGMYDSSNKSAQNHAWRMAFRTFLENLHGELTTLKYAQIAQHPHP